MNYCALLCMFWYVHVMSCLHVYCVLCVHVNACVLHALVCTCDVSCLCVHVMLLCAHALL